MTVDLDRWMQLEAQARWRLEHPDQAPPRDATSGMALHLRLWWYPRSAPHVSWSVILSVRDQRSARAVIREVVWDRPADRRSRENPVQNLKRRQALAPTIRSRDGEMTWEELSPFLDVIAGMKSPVLACSLDDPSPKDVFGLEGHRALAHVRIEWSDKGPAGWGKTLAWIGRLRRSLAQSLRDRDTVER